MSFGLKNAGATYQRAIQQCLHDETRDDLVEAYVDDVVVKTRDACTLIDNLDRTFKALNKYKCKLNPKNAFSGFPPVYCSTTLSAATAYGQTLQKSRRCSICDLPKTLKTFKNSWGAWLLSVGLSLGWEKKGFLSLSY